MRNQAVEIRSTRNFFTATIPSKTERARGLPDILYFDTARGAKGFINSAGSPPRMHVMVQWGLRARPDKKEILRFA
jgi:hypothetical protein